MKIEESELREFLSVLLSIINARAATGDRLDEIDDGDRWLRQTVEDVHVARLCGLLLLLLARSGVWGEGE